MNLQWEKRLDDLWTVREFEPPKTGVSLPCAVIYEDPEDDEIRGFYFRDWGMDRDEITPYLCYLACEGLQLENSNTSLQSLKQTADFYGGKA